MKFETNIHADETALLDILKDVDCPLFIWGHSRVGKSAIVRRWANKKSIKCTEIVDLMDYEIQNNNVIWTMNILRQIASDTSTVLEVQWNDNPDFRDNFQKIVTHLKQLDFFNKHRLIIYCRPRSESVYKLLLGPELLQIRERVKYLPPNEEPYSCSTMKNVKTLHLAIYPDVERWINWASSELDHRVVKIIASLHKSSPINAYEALYGFLMVEVLDPKRYFSPTDWVNASENITGKEFLFQDDKKINIKQFSQNNHSWVHDRIILNLEDYPPEGFLNKINETEKVSFLLNLIKNLSLELDITIGGKLFWLSDLIEEIKQGELLQHVDELLIYAASNSPCLDLYDRWPLNEKQRATISFSEHSVLYANHGTTDPIKSKEVLTQLSDWLGPEFGKILSEPSLDRA